MDLSHSFAGTKSLHEDLRGTQFLTTRGIDTRHANNSNGMKNQDSGEVRDSYRYNGGEESNNDNYDDDMNLSNNNSGKRCNQKCTFHLNRRHFVLVVFCLVVALIAIVSTVLISKQVQRQDEEAISRCCACLNSATNATSSSSSSESCFCTSYNDQGSAIDLSRVNYDDTTVEFTTADQLCTLVQISPDGKNFKPVARSYDGHPWEVSAGAFSTLVTFDCTDSDTCTAVLPSLPDDDTVYQLRSFPRVNKSAADTIARFLEQATFGITRAGIESFQGNDSDLAMAKWIQKQQNEVQITSHRKIYRERMNARKEFATVQGKVTNPCEAGARYRRYAFSDQDFGKNLTIDVQSSNRTVLSVDGFVRTVISGPVTNYSDPSMVIPSGSYPFYCFYWSSYVGGSIFLDYDSPDNKVSLAFNFQYGNPIVRFEPGVIEPNLLLNIPANGAVPIDTQYFEGHYQGSFDPMPEIILTTELSDSMCANITSTGNPIHPVFALLNGTYWIHDPRFVRSY